MQQKIRKKNITKLNVLNYQHEIRFKTIFSPSFTQINKNKKKNLCKEWETKKCSLESWKTTSLLFIYEKFSATLSIFTSSSISIKQERQQPRRELEILSFSSRANVKRSVIILFDLFSCIFCFIWCHLHLVNVI